MELWAPQVAENHIYFPLFLRGSGSVTVHSIYKKSAREDFEKLILLEKIQQACSSM
jgi:hypothetical protein